MASYYDEAKIFADLIKDKNRLKSQIAGQSEVLQIGKKLSNRFNVFLQTLKIRDRSIYGNILIWNNISFGTWNSYIWGIDPNTTFILGHSSAGVLGSCKLGSTVSAWQVYYLAHQDDTYKEFFVDTDYKESATADWDTSSGKLKMSSSSDHSTIYVTQAISSIIWKGVSFTSVILDCDETKFGGDTITYFISTDSSTWNQVTKGTAFAISGTTLYWKIIFLGNGGADTYIQNLEVKIA